MSTYCRVTTKDHTGARQRPITLRIDADGSVWLYGTEVHNSTGETITRPQDPANPTGDFIVTHHLIDKGTIVARQYLELDLQYGHLVPLGTAVNPLRSAS